MFFLFCFFLCMQGQATTKRILRFCRKSNSSESFCLVICSFHKDTIKTKQAMLRTKSNMAFFRTKGKVIAISIVWSGHNSNSSEILCRLSASLIKSHEDPKGYVLVTCKLEDDPIKREGAILWTLIFFHYKYMEKISSLKGHLNQSEWSDLARNRTRPWFYGCPRYLQVWWRSDQKWSCYPADNIFPGL